MQSFIAMMPVQPGTLDTWRAFIKEATTNASPDMLALFKKGGLSRVRLWHNKAPDGSDMVIGLHEGPAPEKWLPTVLESTEPFAAKFREMAATVHGLTPEAAQNMPPPPELAADFQV